MQATTKSIFIRMRSRPARSGLAALLCALASLHAVAADAPGGAGIYTCTTADGRKLTSDRLIPECANREHHVLNRDGSLRATLPPLQSPEERANQELLERKRNAERATQLDAQRRDRNLMMRFPNEAAHHKVRDAALDDINTAMRSSEKRLKELALERRPLMSESEFYTGKPLPPKLKQQLDANDAAADAQRALIENQKVELVRITALYDAELARLRQLWAGAAPGSLGPAVAPAPAKQSKAKAAASN